MATHRHRLVAAVFPLILLLLLPATCRCSTQSRRILPGFQGSQMNWIDNDGLFLLSNSSAFAFGFRSRSPADPTAFVLAVVHQLSSRVVWAANSASPVSNSDMFVFGADGDARLQSGRATLVWSTNTSAQGAAAMVLLDSGNLVVLGEDPAAAPLWRSFDHPSDTLLSGQTFSTGMTLTSRPNTHNLSYHLHIHGGDMVLLADFRPPQPYWTMKSEKRIIKNKLVGDISTAVLVAGSWNLYDGNHSLLGQFITSDDTADANATRAAVLGKDGFISFYSLDGGDGGQTRIPQDPCDTPEPCDPYYICYPGTRCQCPAVLGSDSNCNPDIVSLCTGDSFSLQKVDDGVGYFATGFVKPALTRSTLTGCREACMGNCSCLALFFDDASSNCFLFDQMGSLQQLSGNTASFSMYIKIPDDGGGGPRSADGGVKGKGGGVRRVVVIVIIALVTVAVIVGLIYLAVRVQRRKRSSEPSHQGSSEEDNFLENISGMPIRFSYTELREATDNFSVKLGQGGFGSVYLGRLSDGSRVAVKKLEGISQGKKEFRAEVSIIGSIHHIHLVRLRGFCAEGTHRLLAYEYMANGSLDRWIFCGGGDEDGRRRQQLDWEKRFNIALGTAKGLAYLHEDCESKIVHCDIKPENVLLDDHFVAKVSDFGLAKLMTREQSHVFTTLRGTRGYLAPEWITNYAISEKSDVYSFGMVLLEIIGGRKNFDPSETSEKAHFPSYALKKMEEGKLEEVFDRRLVVKEEGYGRVEAAVKVALWCIQEDMVLRPSMSKVVQMLEGVAEVPQPPMSSQMGFRLYANIFNFKTISEEGPASSTSGPSDCNSEAFLSAVRLSGPR